jgi:hypothetical protein
MRKIVAFIVIALIVVVVMVAVGFAGEMVWVPALALGGIGGAKS